MTDASLGVVPQGVCFNWTGSVRHILLESIVLLKKRKIYLVEEMW